MLKNGQKFLKKALSNQKKRDRIKYNKPMKQKKDEQVFLSASVERCKPRRRRSCNMDCGGRRKMRRRNSETSYSQGMTVPEKRVFYKNQIKVAPCN